MNSQKWHELLDAVCHEVESGLVATLTSELERFDRLASQVEQQRFSQLVSGSSAPVVGDLIYVKAAEGSALQKVRIEQVERASDGELVVQTALGRNCELHKWCELATKQAFLADHAQ